MAAILLATCTLAMHAGASSPSTPPLAPPGRAPHYELLDARGAYRLVWRARNDVTPDWDAMHVAVHACKDAPLGGPWLYNWVARRDPSCLVSGDLPRIALMRTYREDSVAPPFHKLGDLRIRLTLHGQPVWLDDLAPWDAAFHPWGTVHTRRADGALPFTIRLTSVLAQNRGVLIRLHIGPRDAKPDPVDRVELVYGGLDIKGPQFIPPYFLPDATEAHDNRVILSANEAVLEAPDMPARVHVLAWPDPAVRTGDGAATGNRVIFQFPARDPATIDVSLLASVSTDDGQSPLTPADADAIEAEARAHFDMILSACALSTPDALLDAAFDASLLNLEYVYQPPAWLEGVHEWPAYYCNNYQISAAIALGQADRARDALLLFGEAPGGPCPVSYASGPPPDDPNREAGLPYYLLQLHRYWLATGDDATIERLWAPAKAALEHMLIRRDPDGDLLLNWHQGCNAFMYQADHLGQPGAAPSPTFMVAGNLEQMAAMAAHRGDSDLAAAWRRRAAYMREEALRRLWRPAEGRFAAVDPQDRVQRANYYTDFVFPVLYGDVPGDVAWILLRSLDETLWEGDYLMRSGNLKPPLFGNDMFGPVQMSEAAEAYFQCGRADRGWALLHGVARAATLYTDSPGAFPEFMTNSGWGQADYLFGNPAGAFAHAVVAGLFGWTPRPMAAPCQWAPVLPRDWERAALRLPDAALSVEGPHGDRRYVVQTPVPRRLEVRLPLYGHAASALTDGSGDPVPFDIEPHPGGGYLRASLPAAKRHVLRLESTDRDDLPRQVEFDANSPLSIPLPCRDAAVRDPQGALETLRIASGALDATPAAFEGNRTIFIEDRQASRVIPIDLVRRTAPQAPPAPTRLKGRREPIDLSNRFNAETLRGLNLWRFGDHRIDLSGRTQTGKGSNEADTLAFDGFAFDVRPSGRNLLTLELGGVGAFDARTYLSPLPSSVRIPVEGPAIGFDLLTACEVAARHTGMRIGALRIHYSDGHSHAEPLVYGRNIDGFLASYATEVSVLALAPTAHLAAWTVPADASRVVDAIEIEVEALEAVVGIVAMNRIAPDNPPVDDERCRSDDTPG